MGKMTLASGWLQGCSGCHMALLDLHQELPELLERVTFLSSPLMDLKSVPEVTIALIEGAVGNKHHLELLEQFRRRSTKLVALGTCACFGGISGLRNLYQKQAVLERCYKTTESTFPGQQLPGAEGLPEILDWVKPLGEVVKVDCLIPGCPPLPSTIRYMLEAILEDREPVLPQRSLCAECDREQREILIPRREFLADSVTSYMELETIDPEKCFLEQGVLCMGPATREGCGARCLHGNMPCRGCMGPTPGALEQGAKLINALASILPAGGLMFMEDIVGTGYRYSLPSSILPRTSAAGGGRK